MLTYCLFIVARLRAERPVILGNSWHRFSGRNTSTVSLNWRTITRLGRKRRNLRGKACRRPVGQLKSIHIHRQLLLRQMPKSLLQHQFLFLFDSQRAGREERWHLMYPSLHDIMAFTSLSLLEIHPSRTVLSWQKSHVPKPEHHVELVHGDVHEHQEWLLVLSGMMAEALHDSLHHFHEQPCSHVGC